MTEIKLHLCGAMKMYFNSIWILFTYFKLVIHQRVNQKMIVNHLPNKAAEDLLSDFAAIYDRGVANAATTREFRLQRRRRIV